MISYTSLGVFPPSLNGQRQLGSRQEGICSRDRTWVYELYSVSDIAKPGTFSSHQSSYSFVSVVCSITSFL